MTAEADKIMMKLQSDALARVLELSKRKGKRAARMDLVDDFARRVAECDGTLEGVAEAVACAVHLAAAFGHRWSNVAQYAEFVADREVP